MNRYHIAATVVLGFQSLVSAQVFTPLDVPGAEQTRALAMSVDGTAVVGSSTLGAWRWRQDLGIQVLSIPLVGAEPSGVANNGEALVGISGVQGLYAFAWTATAGAVGLVNSDRNGPSEPSLGPTICEDGSTAGGAGYTGGGYLWNTQSGLGASLNQGTFTPTPLGPPSIWCPAQPPYLFSVVALAPQCNAGVGSEVELGSTYSNKGCIFYNRCSGTLLWNPPAASHNLQDAHGYMLQTNPPIHASRDFSRILYQHSLWDERLGLMNLGQPSGYTATRISGDGRTIVFVPQTPSPTIEGLLWLEHRGFISIRTALTEAGCRLDGWSSLVVTGVNLDGTHICGYGISPSGETQGWFATVRGPCWGADFNHDGDVGTDQDIDSFMACVAGVCCPTCSSADFDHDGDVGTDADIEAFFLVLAGHPC